MRPSFLAACLLALTACGPDLLQGTFTFTMTGTETNTAPNTSVSSSSGSGTIAITLGKTEGYVLTIAQVGSEPCVFNGTRNKDKAFTLDLAAAQACTLSFSGGSVTATLTTGTATVAEDALTASLGYGYQGSTFFGTFAGNGTRAYTGTRR